MGAFMLGDEVIHDTEAHGNLTLGEMTAQSSNIGFAKLGMKIGADKMFSWAKRFGFGEATKIGLPGEDWGLLAKPRDSFSLSAFAFGQGVGVTAIQLASAYGAIANGGVLMRPYIVKEARDARGSVRLSNRPKPVRRVVSGRVSRTLIEMLEGVVTHGTGKAAAIPGYRVCGKTGTAQVSDSRGYLPDAAKLVTFVGFLPAEAPRILVLVAMDRPKYGSGGGVAGPVFKEIALAAIRQAGIPASPGGMVAMATERGN
jgi:cell division protein FtsI (penicillin-binding protein 3)